MKKAVKKEKTEKIVTKAEVMAQIEKDIKEMEDLQTRAGVTETFHTAAEDIEALEKKGVINKQVHGFSFADIKAIVVDPANIDPDFHLTSLRWLNFWEPDEKDKEAEGNVAGDMSLAVGLEKLPPFIGRDLVIEAWNEPGDHWIMKINTIESVKHSGMISHGTTILEQGVKFTADSITPWQEIKAPTSPKEKK